MEVSADQWEGYCKHIHFSYTFTYNKRDNSSIRWIFDFTIRSDIKDLNLIHEFLIRKKIFPYILDPCRRVDLWRLEWRRAGWCGGVEGGCWELPPGRIPRAEMVPHHQRLPRWATFQLYFDFLFFESSKDETFDKDEMPKSLDEEIVLKVSLSLWWRQWPRADLVCPVRAGGRGVEDGAVQADGGQIPSRQLEPQHRAGPPPGRDAEQQHHGAHHTGAQHQTGLWPDTEITVGNFSPFNVLIK